MTEIFSFGHENVSILLDYVGGVDAIYVGECPAGDAAVTSIANFRIKKMTYDANSNVTSIKWANKEAITFTQI